jgi:hypothetical protein
MVWPFTRTPPSPPVIPPPSIASGETTITPYVPGAGRVMITDGGPHSAGAWAQVTAQHIAPLNPNLGGSRYIQALKLQSAIAEALTPHHAKVQSDEREKLAKGHEHLLTELDADPHINAALDTITNAARDSEWEAHFSSDEVQRAIRHELGVHFRSVQHIERSWHIDRHAHLPEFQSWARANGIAVK